MAHRFWLLTIKGIINQVNQVKIEDVLFKGNKNLIEIIGEDVDKAYLNMVKNSFV